MFHHIKTCSAPGGDRNEDALAAASAYLAVVDGATGLNRVHLTGAASDAQWLSHRLAALLEEELEDMERELPDILRRAAGTLREELDRMGYRELEGAYPSASLAILRCREGMLEGCSLGDCPVLLGGPGGVELLRDDAVPRRDAAVAEWMAETCRSRHISMKEARRLAEPILLKNRQEMNRPSSYWIFEPTGAGIPHSCTFRRPLAEVREVALLTDGFFAFYRPFGLAVSLADLLSVLREQPLPALLEQLRAQERQDHTLMRFPRFKISDDATAIYADVSAS